MSRTLRFNISQEMTDFLKEFHSKNQTLERNEYKKQWESFIDENRDMISSEERKLMNQGFEGDIEKKLYTSVKYYLSKKSNDKNEPKERRAYIHIDKHVLESMDDHITSTKQTAEYTPAKGYTNFCETYEQELIIEKNRLRTISELNEKEIEFKIKKTYKNRYFILCK